MHFLANENFPLPSVHVLRNAGHDVISVTEETRGIADARILERAVTENRIILTFDRDYGELIYRLGMAPAPVLLLRYDPDSPHEPAYHILRLLQIGNLDLHGRFTVADRHKIRQRLLPSG